MEASHPMVPGWAPAFYNQSRRRALVRVHLSAESIQPAAAGAEESGPFGFRLMSLSPGGDFETEEVGWIAELAGGEGGARWIDVLIRIPKAVDRLDLFASPGSVGAEYSIRVVEAGALPRSSSR